MPRVEREMITEERVEETESEDEKSYFNSRGEGGSTQKMTIDDKGGPSKMIDDGDRMEKKVNDKKNHQ